MKSSKEKKKEWRDSRKEKGLCVECKNVADKNVIRCAKHHKMHLDYSKKYRREFPERYLLEGCKSRSKRNNFAFNLEKSDIIIPKLCPILRIPLFINDNHIGDNSPTLDRIKPELGYVKGNVMVISNRANVLKSDATLDELVLLGIWAREMGEF